MAKVVKKKKELTIEEKLAEALVPVDEQPYQVPENWCWTKVGAVCSFFGGGTPSKNTPEYWNGGIPWASVKDVKGDYLLETQDYISDLGYQNSATNMCEEEDLLLVTRIEPAKTIISKIKTSINQDLKIVKSYLSSIFLHYYFKNFQHVFESKASGSTVKGITIPNIENTPIPLPPLPEQQRIVDRIESLFAKLDEAKEKAQTVVDGFENRKAAILHKAFTGELTAGWRKRNHIYERKWSVQTLSSITENHDSKRIPLSKEERANLTRKYDYYGASGVIDQVDRYLFDGKYLLIGEDGANLVTRSKPIAFIAEGQYWVNNHAHILSTKEVIVMEFLCYYINSISLHPYVTGSAQPKMTQAKMNNIPIPVPKIEEQQVIVRILDNLIAGMSQAKEAAEQVISQIDTMKKSILARAFRGELGTNDPADESAVELLKRIL